MLIREMKGILNSGEKHPYAVFMRRNRSGSYKGCFTRKNGWFERCDNEKWELFVDTCPQDAKHCKALPSWARILLGVDENQGQAPLEAMVMAAQHAHPEVQI